MKRKTVDISAYSTPSFNVPSHRLSFSEWNESGKEVVLYIHSLITNSHDFDYVGNALSADFRVIAVDMPGRGDSDWFSDGSLYNYEVYIADLLSLLKSLDISSFHFAGSSMGGIIGMILASSYPDMIKSLILNDIGPEIPGKALAKIRKYIGFDVSFPDFETAKKNIKMIFRNFGIENEDHWDHMTMHNTKKGEDGLYRMNYDPNISQSFIVDMDNPEDVVFWDVWDKILSDTLLIHGTDSDILLEKTVDKMNLRHNMDVYKIHDVGHTPALFDEKEISYIYSWLKNGSRIESGMTREEKDGRA